MKWYQNPGLWARIGGFLLVCSLAGIRIAEGSLHSKYIVGGSIFLIILASLCFFAFGYFWDWKGREGMYPNNE